MHGAQGGLDADWARGMLISQLQVVHKGTYTDTDPAGTLRYIYIVLMFGGYVGLMQDFMLECLVILMLIPC